MKIGKAVWLVLTCLAFFFRPDATYCQLHDYDGKLGIQFSGALPATEFWETNGIKGSYLTRAFGRFGLSSALQLELGAGYGSLAGLDFKKVYYRTEIIPADLRLIVNFLNNENWNPYLYAGIGGLKYEVTSFPQSVSPMPVEKSGYTGVVPAGLGFEVALADNVILDINGGVNYSFVDDLNYYRLGEAKDAFFTAGIGFAFVTGSGSADHDADGLTNKEERQLHTDSNNPDTDGDGLSDGDEVHKYKTDPTKADTDDDGLNDGDEVMKYHLDPLKSDTDGDGLSDGDEINKYHTNASKADTDGDGLSDGEEVNTYHSDPTKADTDGDGLKDGDEVNHYHTNPLKADSDDDGVIDADEVNRYRTDPNKADTDGDHLSDGDEVYKYATDPTKADTDGGGVNDDVEIANGTNPLDRTDDVAKKEKELKVEVGVPIVLEGIVFKTGSADISPQSETILTQAFNTLDRHPEIQVEIQGHTDNVGKPGFNLKLSKKRANAVRNWLIHKGISATRITAKGLGAEEPVASNETAEGRQKNRRIEFLRTK